MRLKFDWLDTYTDRELIEMSAKFVGIESGGYEDGKGLLIKGKGPEAMHDYASFKCGKAWNPLVSDLDHYVITEEFIARELSLSLPPCPESRDPKVYGKRMLCIEIAEMMVA